MYPKHRDLSRQHHPIFQVKSIKSLLNNKKLGEF